MKEQTSAQFTNRPTVAEISLPALRHNFEAIKKLVSPAKVMGVVKANGYGHGIITIARELERIGADSLGVAYIEEAVELRRAGISVPILVFGGLLKDQLELYIVNDVDVTASSVSKLEQIDESAGRLGKRARVHLKIDTGLERIGVHYYAAQTLFDAALRSKHCDVVGIYSHFADVDPDDLSLAREQLHRFMDALRYYEPRASMPFDKHIAASGGLLALPDSRLDMVRPGLSLYGVYPHQGMRGVIDLRPGLALKSQVVFFKVVKKGAGVSYGHRWHAPEDSRIVTVPIGYGDGYPRSLTNRGWALIRGERYSIVGAVCMDQLMVNLGASGVGYNGDEVVLIGQQGSQFITVEELAEAIDTTPHEILVTLNQRIPRVVQG
jgi:alanine racemase